MKTIMKLGLLLFVCSALPAQASLIRMGAPEFHFDRDELPMVFDSSHRDWADYLSALPRNTHAPRWAELLRRLPTHVPVIEHDDHPRGEVGERPPVSVWEPPVFGLMMVGLVGIVGMRKRMNQLEG